MFKTPAVMMFISTSVGGALMVLTSSSWFGIWAGLELNLLSFLPVVMVGSYKPSVEAGLKYFLIQACGSLVVLQTGLMVTSLEGGFMKVLMLALVLKAGGAPCHFWLPMVAEGMSWGKVGLLFSVQKLAPLTLLSYLCSYEKFLFVCILLSSALVGTIGGVNELLLRKLLAFSSISHFSWLCLAMTISAKVWLFYYFSYCLMVWSLVWVLHQTQVFHLTQVSSSSISKSVQLLLGVSFLSLGGMPPFLGFLPKWIVIEQSVSSGMSASVLVLVVMSLVSLFYYIRASISMYLSSGLSVVPKGEGLTLSFSWVMGLNVSGLWLGSFIWGETFALML